MPGFPKVSFFPSLKHPPRQRGRGRYLTKLQETLTSRVPVGHVQLNGAAHGTRAARAAQLAHTSPSQGCSRRRVFSFCPSLLSPNCCICHCLQWERDRTRLAGFGQPLLMPHGLVERTSGPCSHLSATEKAGAWRNQPARVGSSSQKEDKHTILTFIIMPLVSHCNGLCIYVQLPEHPGRLLKPGSSWRY